MRQDLIVRGQNSLLHSVAQDAYDGHVGAFVLAPLLELVQDFLHLLQVEVRPDVHPEVQLFEELLQAFPVEIGAFSLPIDVEILIFNDENVSSGAGVHQIHLK